jgi:hypothetical protein
MIPTKYGRPRRLRPITLKPKPRTVRDPVVTTFQTPSKYFVCAENGGGGDVVADRIEAGPWEHWTVHTHDDGRVSLQASNGMYLCAELDGTVIADRRESGEWERFAIETRDVGVAFKSAHGKYLCAENGGGGFVTCNRPRPDQDPSTVPGAWEFFMSAVDFWTPPQPPAILNPNTLQGELTRNGRVIGDRNGPRLLMFAHFMEAFSAFCWGKYDVEAQLKTIAEHYAGIRVLDVLGYWDCNRPGDPDHWVAWEGREVTPIEFVAYSGRVIPPTPHYWDRKREFITLCHSLGLKILDDRGDMNAWSHSQKITHMETNGAFYAGLPFGRDVLAGVFAINEAWQNGGDSNDLLAEMIAAFGNGAGFLPAVRGLSAPGGDSDPEDLAACDPPMSTWEPEMPDSFLHWSIDPATVLTVHGNRGDHTHIIEHYFNYGYDDTMRASGKVAFNTEPVGGGEGVSVGRVDNPELLCGITAAALIGGQPWVFMSGNGVFWDGPIETMPGFAEVARLPTFLPNDLAAFPIVCHAGSRFQGTRILAAVDPTRADHAIAADGRFAIVVHTAEAKGHALPCERACAEFTVTNPLTGQVERTGPLAKGETYQHAGIARLVTGRLA